MSYNIIRLVRKGIKMTKGIILTSHGSLASGVYSSVRMITGDFDKLRICELHKGDNFDDLDKSLLKAYEDLKACDNILVLCDMLGGTPFNRAVISLGSKKNASFLAGLNFEMLYQALTLDLDDRNELIGEILRTSKRSIAQYKD